MSSVSIEKPDLEEEIIDDAESFDHRKESDDPGNDDLVTISSLPKERGYLTDYFYQFQGFWYDQHFLRGAIWAQAHFKAQPTDIVLATYPKTGLTWLKALAFATMNRARLENCPLLTKNPHDCVPYIEFQAYEKDPISALESLPQPRLLSTHIPYNSLPGSVLASNCKIVCITRDPKDMFVSMLSFLSKINVGNKEPISKDEAFGLFCNGVSLVGPLWDHVLGYWRASKESPERVLFLKYEDLKKGTLGNVEKLAEFLGCPFSSREKENGVMEEIVRFCSIDSLKKLEVNKRGFYHMGQESGVTVETGAFFRKGEVGDSKNHLSEEMVRRIDQITKDKFEPYGLKY
ncbi:cytosolic sulfotransferase 12-like [Punica granatum]|uniref:Sulfotransferase n=1 Tax=Punica granatum TaxID=22663 RepID=A0A6P8CMT2_PUNGR|nr:cytosolic sulfotransferase 12-like [Punica granatum]